ncbi:acyl-CoA dehydrogenase family protein [Samsonia erythrinae]|uniref:Acyl-CoA dehydrogenase n=1 Tax=Samsonia erythrinae TaxID=160434 RepID=A0A4R3VK80_9GAMM|nr:MULTISPECIES: acyl-CoA dehydrogenase family protein [Enterobacterales]TCV06343.1 hypothetical protein EDC54_104252 [Samsonia erythrinae]WHS97200.1 MAG: Acyl-CoA dehydrogenase [Pantoea stewartii]
MTWTDNDRNRFLHWRSVCRSQLSEAGELHDKSGYVSEHALSLISQERMLCPFIPESFGGLGMSMHVIAALHEEMGRSCASLRSLLTVHSMVAFSINRSGTFQQKQRFLPYLVSGQLLAAFALSEERAGSDPSAMITTASRSDEGWVLNGHKKWISLATIANLFLVFARTTDERISAFLVPADLQGVNVEPISGIRSMRASMLGHIHFDNCQLNHDALLGIEGFGFPFIATDALTLGRLSVASGALGMLQDCLEHLTVYASKRQQGGQVIVEHQLVKEKLASIIVDLTAGRALTKKTAIQMDADQVNAAVTACITKQFCSQACSRGTSDAVQLFGAKGIAEDSPVFRHYQDARVNEIIEGSTQILSLLIAEQASLEEPYP